MTGSKGWPPIEGAGRERPTASRPWLVGASAAPRGAIRVRNAGWIGSARVGSDRRDGGYSRGKIPLFIELNPSIFCANMICCRIIVQEQDGRGIYS